MDVRIRGREQRKYEEGGKETRREEGARKDAKEDKKKGVQRDGCK